jgi:hypothetical protein
MRKVWLMRRLELVCAMQLAIHCSIPSNAAPSSVDCSEVVSYGKRDGLYRTLVRFAGGGALHDRVGDA